MRRWVIINVLLGAIVLLLGIEIVRVWARVLPPVEAPARQPVTEHGGGKGKRGGKNAALQTQQAPAAMVAMIGDRDLFDPSRRAATVEEVKVDVPKETGPPPGVTITGVRIFGHDREVFVTDASQGNTQRRLRVGDQISGYTIKSIEDAGLTLASPSGDAVNMPLEVDKGKAPTMPAAAPPRPGRPGQPATAAVPAPSPAAGVPVAPAGGVRPPPPILAPGQPVAVPPPGQPAQGQNPQLQQMPADVRQKLEQLNKRNDATPRLGRKQH